jgi:hypothetical protein
MRRDQIERLLRDDLVEGPAVLIHRLGEQHRSEREQSGGFEIDFLEQRVRGRFAAAKVDYLAILDDESAIYAKQAKDSGKPENVIEKIVERIRWWEEYTARNKGEMNNNPSPGNKAGGLTTILEKSLGAVAKGGTTNLVDVYEYAQPITAKGFVFMDTPGFDPPSVTGLVVIAGGGQRLIDGIETTHLELVSTTPFASGASERSNGGHSSGIAAIVIASIPLWVVLFFISIVIFVFMLFFADRGERAVVQTPPQLPLSQKELDRIHEAALLNGRLVALGATGQDRIDDRPLPRPELLEERREEGGGWHQAWGLYVIPAGPSRPLFVEVRKLGSNPFVRVKLYSRPAPPFSADRL